MILSIILLILFIIALIFITFFTLYFFVPVIRKNNENDDIFISLKAKNTAIPEKAATNSTDKKAVVMCSCKKEFALARPDYNKEYSCKMIKSLFCSGLDCKFACIGLGDCAKVCEQSAIVIENTTAVITANCNGCGKCVDVCPQNIIELISSDTAAIVKCGNVTGEKTSCSAYKKEEKAEWKPKKDFKIWAYCYRIINRTRC